MAIDGGGVSLELLRQMLNANDPDEVARHAREWKSLASELYGIAPEVDRITADLGDSFDSQHAGPAFRAKLVEAVSDLDVTAGRLDRNGNLVTQAADVWRKARDAANNASSDSDAQPIRSALSQEHAAIAAQLDLFNESYRPDPGPDETGGDTGGGITSGSGHERTSGGRAFVPTARPGDRSSSFAGRFAPGPTLGQRGGPVVDGKLGTGPRGGTSGARTGASTTRGSGVGGGHSGRVGLPGARGGAPIGGYRPVAGAPGTSNGGMPPGGPAQGKPTPGGPGRPGAMPPGSMGPGQPGRDRPGRRLTNYEKLEPNVFRDTRHRVKPVIGEQRRQPDTFEATPGAIGGKQTEHESRKTPDLPTRDSPVRLEGHDVSVSRRSRRAGP